jgi:hypothetical protein
MQRWEYMTWVVGYANSTDSELQSWQGGAIKYVNGKLMPDWKNGPRLPTQLAQAGQEGWELVTVAYPSRHEGASNDPFYIFKRPAP